MTNKGIVKKIIKNFKLYKNIFLGLHKTIYINLKFFKMRDALKFPIILSYRTKLLSLSGDIIVESKIKPGMIKIGLSGAGPYLYKSTILEIRGTVVFGGITNIGGGCSIISVNENSLIRFGDRFDMTGGTDIISNKSITFGCNCIVSWGNTIMDTDFHSIISGDRVINEDSDIKIGDNVWICNGSTILKGCNISNNNIVAANSNIYKNIDGEYQIVTGDPIRVLKKNVQWKR